VCDSIKFSAASLFKALKYIYALTDENFYNINVKDIFKIALNDINNVDILDNMGITLSDEILGELSNPRFDVVEGLIHYAFLIRLPFLRVNTPELSKVKEKHMKEVYSQGLKNGAENFEGNIEHDFNSVSKIAKSRQPEPPFDGEWFRRWVYTFADELSAITNRNMFLLGSIDALFPLYYAALPNKISQNLNKIL